MLCTRQNWIGGGHLLSSPLTADYVPPPSDLVPDLMLDLVARINKGVGHPIIEMAIVHAQFEMTHPFGDGNGRTGRALIQIMLQKSKLNTPTTLPLSASLAVRSDQYLASLASCNVARAAEKTGSGKL